MYSKAIVLVGMVSCKKGRHDDCRFWWLVPAADHQFKQYPSQWCTSQVSGALALALTFSTETLDQAELVKAAGAGDVCVASTGLANHRSMSATPEHFRTPLWAF